MAFAIRDLRDKFNIDLYPELKNMPDSYLSYIHHSSSHQAQRLEYLGDSVLDLIVSDLMFDSFHDLGPGDLTELGSLITKNLTLAYILIKKNICTTRNKKCADKLEVLIGIIYSYTGKNIAFVEKYLDHEFGLGDIVYQLIESGDDVDNLVDNITPIYSKWIYGTCIKGKSLDIKRCISGNCKDLTREYICSGWSECKDGYRERYLNDGSKEVEVCNTVYGKCDKNGMRTVTNALGEFTNEICPEELYEEDYITDSSCTNGKIMVYKKCKDSKKCTDILWDSYPCDN